MEGQYNTRSPGKKKFFDIFLSCVLNNFQCFDNTLTKQLLPSSFLKYHTEFLKRPLAGVTLTNDMKARHKNVK